MAEGYWVIRTYTAGAVGEKIKYWVPGERPTRSQRKIKSDIKQQQRNEANAEKKLARTLNENFSHADHLLRLSYAEEAFAALGGEEEEPETLWKNANRQLKLWLRRTRRACKAAGVPFRYVPVTADLDGKTGEYVRVHHHVVVNAEAAEIAREKWTAGGTHCEHLYNEVDYLALAHYLLAQVRYVPDEKKYCPSRNLKQPQPKDVIARSGAELSVPRGGQLLHRAGSTPGMPQYIRYILPEVGKIRRERENEKRTE